MSFIAVWEGEERAGAGAGAALVQLPTAVTHLEHYLAVSDLRFHIDNYVQKCGNNIQESNSIPFSMHTMMIIMIKRQL